MATFPALLQHTKTGIQKEAAWTISNITAGNVAQIQQVIDYQLVPLVINILVKVNVFIYKTSVICVIWFRLLKMLPIIL